MITYSGKINYFKQLAISDPDIAYHQPGELGNNSFFDCVDEETLLAAIKENVHYPFVWLSDMSGRLSSPNGAINQPINYTLKFYSKVVLNDIVFDQSTAKDIAYDTTFTILQRWLDWIEKAGYDDALGLEGPIQNVELDSFKWLQLPLFSDGFVGWQLSFTEVHINSSLSV